MPIKTFIRNFRSFLKENLVSLTGLSIGMMVAILSISYIVFESSYDRFHRNSDRIYQLSTLMETEPGNIITMDNTHHLFKDYIDNHIPQVESSTRIYVCNKPIMAGQNKYKGKRGLYVDREFMSIFDFKIIVGEGSVLADPDKVILTQTLSVLIFGDTDCVGRKIRIEKNIYTVGAVIKDPPLNSRFRFDYLLPVDEALRILENHNFVSVLTYIMVSNDFEDIELLSDLLNGFYENYDVKSKEMFSVSLGTLAGFNQFHKKPGSFILFISVSILVLIVSIVNFINSCAAGSELRTKETGIRKVMGASRRSLILDMVKNTILLSVIALLAGLILSELFLEMFRELSGVAVSQYGPGLIWIQLLVILLALIVGLLAGIFPALRYSSPDVLSLITGRGRKGRGPGNIRKALVMVQYIISAGLLIVLFIFYLQLRFLSHKDPGYISENRMLVRVPANLEFRYKSYIEGIKKIPGILSVSGNGSGFGGTNGFGFKRYREEEGRMPSMGYFVQDAFFRTYGIKLISGKTFENTTGGDSANVLIDESTARILGMENPVGEKVILSQREMEIIGMVEDADLIAMKGEREPFFYTQYYDLCCELIIHYSGDPAIIARAVEDIFKEFDPEAEYNFRTVDEARKTLYSKETNQVKIVLFVGIIALLITIVGAYSMASYLSRKRARQVSIRKVMGASVNEVLQLSLREMLYLIVLAFVIASPLAYFVSNKWLQEFTNKISIGPLAFLLAFIVLTLMILITVFFKERQAAMANPVDNLRQE